MGKWSWSWQINGNQQENRGGSQSHRKRTGLRQPQRLAQHLEARQPGKRAAHHIVSVMTRQFSHSLHLGSGNLGGRIRILGACLEDPVKIFRSMTGAAAETDVAGGTCGGDPSVFHQWTCAMATRCAVSALVIQLNGEETAENVRQWRQSFPNWWIKL